MSTLMVAALAAALAAQDPQLAGSWALDGQPFMQLNADGSGQAAEGPLTWATAAGVMTMTAPDGSVERLPYRVAGETLTLTPPGGAMQLTRVRTDRAKAVAPRSAATSHAAPARAIRFNGRPLSDAEWQLLERLERSIGTIADGDYWYDNRTGASGRWGGPTLAFVAAGLGLGGALPANASGGGKGTLTGVFINGREAHPVDVAGLRGLVGAVLPGRWWVDASGNYGQEGGPAMGNLVALARARQQASQGGGTAWSRRYEGATPRDNLNMASDGNTTCVSVSGYSRCTGE